MIIYKDLVNRILTISLDHLAVNFSAYGETFDIINDRSCRYPIIFLQPQPTTVSEKELNYTFNMFYLDQLEKDKSNGLDVFSEGHSVLVDIIFKLNEEPGIKFIFDSTIEPIAENYDQSLRGWVCAITINDFIDLDVCLSPFGENNITS